MKNIVHYLQKYYDVQVLGDITWAHAVNSRERLQRFLNDPEITMLEVDVIISAQGKAVLAHPPAIDSDLSFEDFIQAMSESRQGIKLDLKDPEILLPCLTTLQKSELRQPVLLNAGILRGNQTPKFSAVGFLAACKNLYPQALLSPDWENDGVPYTKQNIDEMLALCQGIRQVTFPVNARLLPSSWEHISRLLEPDDYSLTIWDGKPVEKDLLRWLQEHTNPTNVSYDCFDEQYQRLKWW